MSVTRHVGESLLGDAKEYRALDDVGLFHLRRSGQAGADAGPLGEVGQEGVQRRDEPEIVQHRGAQLSGESMHDVHRLLDQPLSARNVLIEVSGVVRRGVLEGRQADVDGRQRLSHDVMQLPADGFSLRFLCREDLAG